jgi:hypothetical protein
LSITVRAAVTLDTVLALSWGPPAQGQVMELQGAWLIDGYARPGPHLWLYDTQTRRSRHLGKLAYKAGTPPRRSPGVYCGHGQDFSYTSNPEHVCLD